MSLPPAGAAPSNRPEPTRLRLRQLLRSALLRFLRAEAASGIVLITSTVLALGLANSSLSRRVTEFWAQPLMLGISPLSLTLPLRDWISDGLMAVFFLVVGMEIKRELLQGELASPRRAALPALAALGGMVVPALVFLGFTYGTPQARGFGIPTATDIAFTVGVMALLGRRIPLGAKVFVTALAIADDLGAVAVIAVFYSSHPPLLALLPVVGLTLILSGLNLLGVRSLLIYLLTGMLLWLAMHAAGVHATLSGIILALTIPMRGLLGDTDLQSSPLHRLEQRLHPLVAFGVLPLFALVNAGVEFPSLRAGAGQVLSLPTMLGVGFGLLLGKPLGIFGAVVLAIRLRLGELPAQTSYRVLFGSAMLAGIGFTMSIFIAALAFREPSLLSSAKLGILAGSLGAALLGAGFLGLMSSRTAATADPQERP